MNLYVNDIYLPFLEEEEETQIFYGGASSGKSYFLAQRAVLDVLCKGRNYLIARNVANTIRNTVFNEVSKAIGAMGVGDEFRILKNEKVITCKRNRRQILFAGLDDVEKLKSLTPIDGVITDIWMEEATEIRYEAYKQLSKRLRGNTGGLSKRMIFSFNPILQSHWIFKEFFGDWDDSQGCYRGKGLTILKTTYRDNHFLDQGDIRRLTEEKDSYFYKVYTLGEWGVLGSGVFTNWRTVDMGAQKGRFDRIYNGLDFGFSSDPNALVRCHVDLKRKQIYVFEELYKAGMHDDELAEELKARLGGQVVCCDSAEGKSISDLCRRGIRAVPAVKGPDSVNYGIRFLQGFELLVDVGCPHFRNEIQSYRWAEDKYGNALRRPVDRDNHLLDALRYATEQLQLMGRA